MNKRSLARKIALSILTVTFLSPVTGMSQNKRHHIIMKVSALIQAADEFVFPPKHVRKIFYMGDDLNFRLSVTNDSSQELTLNQPQTAFSQHLALKWSKLPAELSASEPTLLPINLYASHLFTPTAKVDNITKLGSGATVSVQCRFALDESRDWVPGVYEFEIHYEIPSDIKGRLQNLGQPVVVHDARYAFELRDPITLEDRLEILHRAAMTHYLNKNYDEAKAKIDQLLTLYPNSSAAYSLLGYIYFDAGDYSKAIEYDGEAIDLLVSGVDVIRLKGAAAGYNKDHLIEFLKGRIHAAKERLKRQ